MCRGAGVILGCIVGPSAAKDETAQHSLWQALEDPTARLVALAQGHDPAQFPTSEPTQYPPLAQVVARLGLYPFEERLIGLCLAAVLVPDAAQALEQLNGSGPGAVVTDPTWRLALAAYPGLGAVHLHDGIPVLRWGIVQFQGVVGLDTPLRLDPYIVSCLVPSQDHYTAPPLEVSALMQPLQVGDMPIRGLGSQIAQTWKAAVESGQFVPTIVLYGATPGARRDVVRTLGQDIGMEVCLLPAQVLAPTPDEAQRQALIIDRHARLSDQIVFIECGAQTLAATGDALARQQTLGEKRALSMGSRLSAFHLVSMEVPPQTLPPGAMEVEVAPLLPAEKRGLLRRILPEATQELFAPQDVALIHDSDQLLRARAEVDVQGRGEDIDAWRHALVSGQHAALGRLAQRLTPRLTLSDLVLSDKVRMQINQITQDASQMTRVRQDWGFERRQARGLGLCAIFAGPSGVGKTSVAEALSAELGFILYRIDLSRVISKYIGETEERLEQIFTAATSASAMLLFDEGEALFGKRTDVKEGRDRYANQEVSYLLQRLESFDGVAILTTNQREAIDDAFTRRFRYIVDFDAPNQEERQEIWATVFPSETPTEGLDYDLLARISLNGGAIANVALSAALMASALDVPIGMTQLRAAIEAECRKARKTLPPESFANWP